MDGVGSVDDVAAAAMRQMGGVTRSDVVEELGGRHGGGGGMTALVGLVTVASNLEEMVDAAGDQAEGVDLDMHVAVVEDLAVQPREVAVMELGVASHFTVGYDASDEEMKLRWSHGSTSHLLRRRKRNYGGRDWLHTSHMVLSASSVLSTTTSQEMERGWGLLSMFDVSPLLDVVRTCTMRVNMKPS